MNRNKSRKRNKWPVLTVEDVICRDLPCSGLPSVFVLEMANALFGLQLLDTFNWKRYIKSTDETIAVKGLPSKKPLPQLRFPSLGKGYIRRL